MGNNILLIDDEELIIKSLKKLLEISGFNVFIAKNGSNALVLADEENFDLIIADIRMPGMNGVDVVKAIYGNLQDRGTDKIPVIFITGYADEETKNKAESLSPYAYIYKPFDNSEFIDKVKSALRQGRR